MNELSGVAVEGPMLDQLKVEVARTPRRCRRFLERGDDIDGVAAHNRNVRPSRALASVVDTSIVGLLAAGNSHGRGRLRQELCLRRVTGSASLEVGRALRYGRCP